MHCRKNTRRWRLVIQQQQQQTTTKKWLDWNPECSEISRIRTVVKCKDCRLIELKLTSRLISSLFEGERGVLLLNPSPAGGANAAAALVIK